MGKREKNGHNIVPYICAGTDREKRNAYTGTAVKNKLDYYGTTTTIKVTDLPGAIYPLEATLTVYKKKKTYLSTKLKIKRALFYKLLFLLYCDVKIKMRDYGNEGTDQDSTMIKFSTSIGIYVRETKEINILNKYAYLCTLDYLLSRLVRNQTTLQAIQFTLDRLINQQTSPA